MKGKQQGWKSPNSGFTACKVAASKLIGDVTTTEHETLKNFLYCNSTVTVIDGPVAV